MDKGCLEIMGKRRRKVTYLSVLLEGKSRQMLLFADALTDLQEELLVAADGSKTVDGLAVCLHKGRKKILREAVYLVKHGYLRQAVPEEIEPVAEDIIASGRLDDGLQLYKAILEIKPEYQELSLKLAELYERTAHSYEAAEIYEKLSEDYVRELRLSEALVISRRAAALKPGNFKTQDNLARLCVQTGRIDEAARVWRAYAIRLAGEGQFERALGIIDRAGSEISGNDILLYAEAEILALMNENKPVEKLMEYDEEAVASDSAIVDIAEDYVADEVEQGVLADNAGVVAVAGDQAVDAASLHADNIVTDHDVAAVYDTDAVEEEVDYTSLSSRQVISGNASVREYQQRGKGIFFFIGVFILFLLVATGVNYYYRHRMHRAVIETQGVNSLIEQASLEEKIDIGRSSLILLEKSLPPFSFMLSSEYSNQYARTELLVREAVAEFEKNNYEYLVFEKKWRNLSTEKLARKLADYIHDQGISERNRGKAQKLYLEWQKNVEQYRRDRKDTIELLADKSFSAEERFAAYKKILLKYPDAFERDYPQGARGLTVPTIIKAELMGSGQKVTVQFAGGAKQVGDVVEVPVDQHIESYILHPGYALCIDGAEINGRSKIVYPLTYEQLYVLKKIPWREYRIDLGFVPADNIVLPEKSGVLFASRHRVVYADLFSGRMSSCKELVRATANMSVGLELFAYDSWFGVIADGIFTLGKISEDEKVITVNDSIVSSSALTAKFVDLELGENSGINIIYSNYFSAHEDADNVSPLVITRVADGSKSWDSKVSENLFKNLSSPVVGIFKVGWYFVLVCKDSEVLVLLENGEIYKRFYLDTSRLQQLRSSDVEYISLLNGEKYLLAGKQVYRVDDSQDFGVEHLWNVAGEGNDMFLVNSQGVVVYGRDRVSILSLNNGEVAFSYKYTGTLAAAPVFFNDNIILPLTSEENGNSRIAALDITSDDKRPEVWEYEFEGKILQLGVWQSGRADKLFVYTEAGRLCLFR